MKGNQYAVLPIIYKTRKLIGCEIKPAKKPVNTTLFFLDSTFNIVSSTINFQKKEEVIKNAMGKI